MSLPVDIDEMTKHVLVIVELWSNEVHLTQEIDNPNNAEQCSLPSHGRRQTQQNVDWLLHLATPVNKVSRKVTGKVMTVKM